MDKLKNYLRVYPWELRQSSVTTNYWSFNENRIKAIRWLVNDVLKFSHEEVINELSLEHFYDNRLTTLICDYYNKSIPTAIMEAFEGEFMPWEFGYHRWNEEDARRATKWLIDKLEREEGKSPEEINYYDFQRHKLRTALERFYSSSPQKAIMDVVNY